MISLSALLVTTMVRATCLQLNVVTTDYQSAPATIVFRMDGYDVNGRETRAYRIDYGDGASDINRAGDFSHTYTTNGAYTVQGYIVDEAGKWVGGTSCQLKLTLQPTRLVAIQNEGAAGMKPFETPTPTVYPEDTIDSMVTQPATGLPWWVLAGTTLSGIGAAAIGLWRNTNHV